MFSLLSSINKLNSVICPSIRSSTILLNCCLNVACALFVVGNPKYDLKDSTPDSSGCNFI